MSHEDAQNYDDLDDLPPREVNLSLGPESERDCDADEAEGNQNPKASANVWKSVEDWRGSSLERSSSQLWSSKVASSFGPKEKGGDKMMEGSVEDQRRIDDERRVESSLAMRPRPLSLIANDAKVTGSGGNAPSMQSPWDTRPNLKENDLLENKKKSLNNIPTPSPGEYSPSVELACHKAEHGVEGLLKVALAPASESISISLKDDESGNMFEGVLRAEGSVESQDIRDAFDSFCQGSIRVHLDKLKIIGVGFQVRLKESTSTVAPVLPLEEQVSRPIMYLVPLEELRSYGWETDPATKYGPGGLVPDDDMYWRGNFTGKVRVILWCGRVLLEGQVSGIGPGMRKHSERPLGTTAYSEVTFPVFRLPPNCRPREVQSFSRRALDLGQMSSEYIGGTAKGVIDYHPLRRLDVLPDGFIVLVTCLHVKTSLRRVLNRPTRSKEPGSWFEASSSLYLYLAPAIFVPLSLAATFRTMTHRQG
eukprot:g24789.t1